MQSRNDLDFLVLMIIGLNAVAWLIFGTTAQACENCGLADYLEKYQSLIAGVMALGAAVITVWQMQISETKQADRHMAIFAQGLEERYFALERAINPALDEFQGCLFHSADVEGLIRERVYDRSGVIVDQRDTVRAYFEKLELALSRRQFLDGNRYFRGTLVASIEELRNEASSGFGAVKVICDFYDDPETSYEAEGRFSLWFDGMGRDIGGGDHTVDAFIKSRIGLQKVVGGLVIVQAQLQDLRGKYELPI